MAIVKMKKLTLAVSKDDADKLMHSLMWTGSVEVSDAASLGSDDPRLSPDERFSAKLSELSAKLSEYERAISFLRTFEKAPKGLFPKRKAYGRDKYDLPCETLTAADGMAERSASILQSLDEIKADEIRTKSSLSALSPWKELDIALSRKGTLTSDVTLGFIPRDISEETVREALALICDSFALETVSQGENGSHISVISLKEDTDKINSTLTKLGFIKSDFSAYSGTVAEECQKLSDKSIALEIEKASLTAEAMQLALSLDVLRLACDIVSSDIAKAESEKRLICTESTVILSGWVPEKKVPKIEKIIEKYDAFSQYSDPQEEDDVPVQLSNNALASPFESVIDMYVLPKYGTFDPTVIMSIFYFIIFGLMLADVVYGLILAIGGFWAVKKLDLPKGTKQLVKLFAICGISCTVAGVFFGSYLGDLPTKIYEAFGGEPFVMPLTLIDTLGDPITFIVVALAVGLIHLLAGLAIQFYVICRDASFIRAFFEVGGWFIVFGGAGLYFIIGTPGLIILGVGLVVMMIGGALKKTGVFGRIIGSFGALYGFVGFASDLISYSRIMALGLTSAIIASVFNILATIALPSPIGFILFIIVIIIGHLLNLGINIIGTFVHASRLQYIEFFGKFYEDGGRKFAPLTTREKYTRITDPEDQD